MAITRVAYLGPEGTHSHAAALTRYADTVELVPYPSIAAAVGAARAAGEVDEALVPLHNSVAGAVAATLDALTGSGAPVITAEMLVPIRHHLVAAAGTVLAAVERVLCVPQAAAQCARWLRERLPRARLEDAVSTAAAVSECVRQPGCAAIGSEAAAHRYGASVLAAGINDDPDNATRFVVVRSTPAGETPRMRATLLVAAEREQTIADALAALVHGQVTTQSVEAPRHQGHLLVDLDGLSSDAVAAAITELGGRGVRTALLGRYPRAG